MKLDDDLRNWVLIPITIFVFLIEIITFYVQDLLKTEATNTKESIIQLNALQRCKNLRMNGVILPPDSLLKIADKMIKDIKDGKYGTLEQQAPNLGDPDQMQNMTEMMQKNMLTMIPQTLIMGAIHMLFSGFVTGNTVKLPFSLPLQFKSMLQRGIETREMDVKWVSSLSWYFLNIFGLKSEAPDTLAGMVPQTNPMTVKTEMPKLLKAELESLELIDASDWILNKL
ncbi:DUF850-domain-containing protein [Rozella allomycis CSF55]|uniref:ER membrane protein complex subunit 3 n=1 Tax=Rozella allomycis (strain CSF55) TaxID=988480 RepID=A0A075ARE8_ROZAC|nr:Protein of unknown function DUF106 domain-containing protein [Rozella allomycis CSF55]RKP21733.1 DUF850-domain-containing protein [Rozella allomycis CSF55]|eukprot:EPZ31301.1 Protein of unknown function DUF106 domain-containing protein [Rozella allomycis CSF55]